jgi:DNA gyrase subunit B
MRLLIEGGKIYVARPPLFKVTQRKQARYIQTNDEMNVELMRRGLEGTKLHLLADATTKRPAATLEGDHLAQVVTLLGELENPLLILERRGLSLASFFTHTGPTGLPIFRVLLGNKEHWFQTIQEVDAFRLQEQERLGHELVIADAPGHVPTKNGDAKTSGNGHVVTFFVQELHEVRAVNRLLERLREFNLTPADLLPSPRLAGREPPPRFHLDSGDSRRVLQQLRELVPEIKRLGEKGLTITRFKGLGEMDPEELWETTLDPAKRVLLKVNLDDALKADEMFRTLMGEKVEPRRDFIQKHALEVKDIDYHGA